MGIHAGLSTLDDGAAAAGGVSDSPCRHRHNHGVFDLAIRSALLAHPAIPEGLPVGPKEVVPKVRSRTIPNGLSKGTRWPGWRRSFDLRPGVPRNGAIARPEFGNVLLGSRKRRCPVRGADRGDVPICVARVDFPQNRTGVRSRSLVIPTLTRQAGAGSALGTLGLFSRNGAHKLEIPTNRRSIPRQTMPLDLDLNRLRFGTELLKRGFAKMQKGGVVMDVTNAEQAAIAEEAGAVAVMALERVPADIRSAGGVARMADPMKIQEIMDAVTVPVMAKCRIGHEAEARALESLGVDMIDESEVLTPADPFFHVNKRGFEVPFVCGARNLGEAVRRTWEGAAMIRTKGEAGTGDVVEAVRHIRLVTAAIAELKDLDNDRLMSVGTKFADSYTKLLKEVRTAQGADPTVREADVVFAGATLDDITEGIYQVLLEIKKIQRLPVVNFAAGGVATPADAALMMLMGCDGVFVGSGIFKAENPETRGRAIVDAVAHFDDPSTVAEVSKGIGLAMKGLDAKALPIEARLQDRGW